MNVSCLSRETVNPGGGGQGGPCSILESKLFKNRNEINKVKIHFDTT